MIKQYAKRSKELISRSFFASEFDCPCDNPSCQTTWIDDELISNLQLLRDVCGPIRVHSGFRCALHNSQISGSADKSRHLTGQGADIRCPKMSITKLLDACKKIDGFRDSGIGSYKSHVHVDVGRTRPARW